jgi:GNAT superfamily N-acetyltransferase
VTRQFERSDRGTVPAGTGFPQGGAPQAAYEWTPRPRIARLGPEHLAAAAELHDQLASVQFVARGGQTFLRRYYLAWSRTSSGLALAATDDAGQLTGVLLGSLDPARHYQDMIRRDGVALALRLIGHATIDPRFGRELIVTRVRRCSRGLARAARTRLREHGSCSPTAATPEALGEIAVLLVDPQRRGVGIGRSLVNTAIQEARHAGLAALALVTPPDYGARGFYEHLGWRLSGSLTSRSGEPFLLYRQQTLTVNSYHSPTGTDPCCCPVAPTVASLKSAARRRK